nr:reverse transcriptase domain-containing protein [Tanacetum cinerariifolium]
MEEKTALITVLKSYKRAIAWKLSDIKGIDPEFCTHKILMEEDFEPAVQHQRRVNPKIHDVIKQEVLKLLDAGLIYPISDSLWVSPAHYVPKKGGFTVVENEENELILTRLVTGWRVCIDYHKLNEATRKDHFPLPFMDQKLERLAGNYPWVSPVHYVPKKGGFTVMENEDNELIPTHLVTGWHVCIDYRKLNEATRKDHFPLPFMDQMLERLAGNQYYCVLDGFSGYFQIPIIPKDQEKTTFTCPYRIYLSHLERMLKRCKDTNLCLNWEKSYFMVKEDWDMPFELMCDASNFAIGAVLGQCQDKHFRLIYYAKVRKRQSATKKSNPSAPKADLRPPVLKPASSQQPKPKPAPAKSQGKKRKLITEISDKPSPARKSKPGLVSKRRKPISSLRSVDESVAEGIPKKEPRVDDEEADVQREFEESLKSIYDAPWGSLPPVVIREPESRTYQLLPEVQGKGKEKVTDEQVESDEDVPGIDALVPGEGQAVPNPDDQDEDQAGPNPDEQDEGHARPNPDVSTQPHPEQMDEGFTATAYPKVQENLKLTVEEQVILEELPSSIGTLSSLQHLTKDLSFGDLFFNDKPSEADNEKTTAETEAESMVSVTIQQDTYSIPPMTTPVIDLTSRPESPNVHQPLKATSTETTTPITTIHPPPSQPQQSTTDSMLMKRIGELEHIMANLIQDNKHLEERLDSHGARLYTLENLDIPQQMSKATDEIVTDAVDWAIQAPLRNRFRDLPEADMKEILHQRMWETNSYKTHEDHMMLYEALEKSMNRDHSEELLKDLAEACKKKKKRCDSPKTPPGSPPHQPPPPPPPAGPFGASRSSGASGSSQFLPPPHPPPSTNQEDLQMDDDMALDAQAQSSNDEDIKNAYIPKVNLRQEWWKPLEEERPATPEPAGSILSSDVPVPKNNWASALASNYSPPPED